MTYATTKCRFAFEKNVKTREKVVESEMNSTRSLLSLAVFFTLGASHQVEVRTDPSTEASFPVGSTGDAPVRCFSCALKTKDLYP